MRLEDLKKLRVFLRRAKAFVTTEDFSPEWGSWIRIGLEKEIVAGRRCRWVCLRRRWRR